MKGTWNKLYSQYLRYAINANREEAVFSHYIQAYPELRPSRVTTIRRYDDFDFAEYSFET